MSYNDEKRKGWRIYHEVFNLELDVNDGDYSADLGSYNTPKTTIDSNAFLAGNINTYSYANQNIGFTTVFPKLTSVSITPAVLKIGEDIALSASATVSLLDFLSNDTFELPQAFADRRVEASHFGKLFERNYILNRDVVVSQGYGEQFDALNYQNSNFVVKGFGYPDVNGALTFSLIDRLFFASESKNKCPALSVALIDSPPDGIDEFATVFNFTGTSFGDKSQSAIIFDGQTGTINIDNELMTYTVSNFVTTGSQAGGDFAGTGTLTVVRGVAGGDVAAAHDDLVTIQGCVIFNSVNVTDVIRTIFNDFSNIGAGFIDNAAWDALGAGTMSDFNLTNIITKPVEIRKLLKELMQSTGAWLYYDVISDLIVLGYTPRFAPAVITLTEQEHILQNSIKIKTLSDKQVTRAKIAYNKRDYTQAKELRYYRNTWEDRDDLLENDAHYRQVNEPVIILSNWYTGTITDQRIANSVATLKVIRFAEPPRLFNLKIDSRYIGDLVNGERLWFGSIVNIVTKRLINADGTLKVSTAQVTSIKPSAQDDSYDVTAIAYVADEIDEDVDLYITSDKVAYNLASAIVPVEVRQYVVVINSGVTIYGYNFNAIQTAALIQGVFPVGSSLKIINQGFIVGFGGDGGDGAYYDDEPLGFPPTSPAGDGQDGGLACQFTTPVVLDNSTGVIQGGGGGGGGGGVWTDSVQPANSDAAGGGGGGGAGRSSGKGGKGWNDSFDGAYNGDDGTLTNGGSAGLGVALGSLANKGSYGGFGGDGGADAVPPVPPVGLPTNLLPDGISGIGGDAITMSGNLLTYENGAGIILGDIVL